VKSSSVVRVNVRPSDTQGLSSLKVSAGRDATARHAPHGEVTSVSAMTTTSATKPAALA